MKVEVEVLVSESRIDSRRSTDRRQRGKRALDQQEQEVKEPGVGVG